MAKNSHKLRGYVYVLHLAKFHKLSSSVSLVIKPKATENITTLTMFLFCILKNYYHKEYWMFFKYLIPHIILKTKGTRILNFVHSLLFQK
jgi:hypothetical protein